MPKFNLWCWLFGHDFEIALNPEDMWIICKRKSCRCEEDIPKERKEEAYENIRNGNWKWIK